METHVSSIASMHWVPLAILLLVLCAIFPPVSFLYRLLFRNVNSRTRKLVQRIGKFAEISIFALFLLELLLTFVSIHQVNTQLGFRYGTPETPAGEVFLITHVVSGGVMDNSGLHRDDRVQMWNVNDLYKLLINNQGRVVLIPVIRNYTELKIRVQVPKLEVPLAHVSLLLF